MELILKSIKEIKRNHSTLFYQFFQFPEGKKTRRKKLIAKNMYGVNIKKYY